MVGAKLATKEALTKITKVDTLDFDRKGQIVLDFVANNQAVEKAIKDNLVRKLTANGRFIFENNLVYDSLVWRPYSLDSTRIYLKRVKK